MSCDCNTLVVGEAGVQGPQGLAGIDGTNGTNGLNAFTTTSASFTQPAVGSPVTISVIDNRWIAVGQTIYISQAGFYTVTSLGGSPYSDVIANLLQTDGISPAATVSTGRKVSPSASTTYSAILSALTVNGTSSLNGAVTVNSSKANVNFIVKGDNADYLLVTNASTDKVGVNIANPAETLDVVGTLKASELVTFVKGATVNSSFGSNDFAVKTVGSNTTLFVKGSTSRVGIGTTSPAALLDVAGASQSVSMLVNPSGANNTSSFKVLGASSGVPLNVDSTNNRVGINKLSPTVALDVTGAAAISGALSAGASTLASLGVTGAATVGTTLGVTGASTLASLGVTGAATVGTTLGVTGASTLASLGVTGAATVGTDFTVDTSTLKVDSTNNRVGVNTTSPAVELDVVGSVQASNYRINTGSGAGKLTKFFYKTTTVASIASIGIGATTAVTVTGVTGVDLGDFVQVTYTTLPSGTFKDVVTISGYVSATDTVVILLANNSVGVTTAQTDLPFAILVTRAASS